MRAVADHLFKATVGTTCRVTRDGKQTLHTLADRAGVSQPAVPKLFGDLRRVNPIRAKGREFHYSSCPHALALSIDWPSLQGVRREDSIASNVPLKRTAE